MDFAPTPRCQELCERLEDFMATHVLPAEAVYEEQREASGTPTTTRRSWRSSRPRPEARGLWNLFHPYEQWGGGLTNLEYAPLAEISGRSHIAPEAINCNAPDTGNMEVLTLFGTPDQQERWLRPLLDGEIRSTFCMTEPDVASSDATNIELSIERDGDEYVLNGRKWWASGALHPNCRILIVMGKTDPTGPTHRQQSMILVPRDHPGVVTVRPLPVFGYLDQEGHAELRFEDVRVPRENLIAGEGDGFLISQARLGPGRIHHCMRTVGVAERALELMCRRAAARTTFGTPSPRARTSRTGSPRPASTSRCCRLLALKTAWLMDTVGNKLARTEIAAIKVAARRSPSGSSTGRSRSTAGAGVSDDVPLASMYAHMRTLRLADGPDEVHKMTIARHELRRQVQDARRRGRRTAPRRPRSPRPAGGVS
jgi:acyl-CoA dehydrogenase